MLASLGRVISTSALFFCLQSTMLARICENMRRISALARFDRAILRSQREEVGRISPLRRRGENRPLGCMRHPNFGSWPHLVSLDPYLPAAGTVGKGTVDLQSAAKCYIHYAFHGAGSIRSPRRLALRPERNRARWANIASSSSIRGLTS